MRFRSDGSVSYSGFSYQYNILNECKYIANIFFYKTNRYRKPFRSVLVISNIVNNMSSRILLYFNIIKTTTVIVYNINEMNITASS